MHYRFSMTRILIFLNLFVLLLGAEGQLFESLFSKRSSQDDAQSGFVEDTSKHFLSLLFTPFNNNQQQYEGGGEMLSGLFSPARSGPTNYDNYRNSASSKSLTSAYGNYNQGYGRANNDYYTCEGCNSKEIPPPPPPSRQVSSGGGADYTCAGCDKYPTEPQPPPAVIDYSCKGCNGNIQKSARSQEYYPASTTFNEHYQSPKVYHEVIGYHKKPKYSVIDTRLRIPPVKFRFHINPKITITTNTQDPLAKTQHHHHTDDDDYIPPPELHPHPHFYGHGYHHHTSRQSHDHSHDHHHHYEEPYGAQITKHEQPIRNKYERSFAIKLNPEIYTDPPPTRPTTTTTARPRTTTSRSRAPLEISPRLQSINPTERTTTTRTTTTSAPSISSDTRSSLDGLREAAESGLSPLEVLLARRRTTTTTEPPKTQQSTTVSPTTTQQSTSASTITLQQREVEEITIKSTAITEAASSNEIEVKHSIPITVVEKIIEATTVRPTQDPRATLAKLREAADAGLSPFEILLSRSNSKSGTERKLSPRKAEAN